MATPMGAMGIAGAGVAISAVYQIGHGNDPFPVIVIGGIWTTAVVLVTSLNAEVGTALAAVFLLGMFLTRGSAIIDWVNKAVQSTNTTKAKNNG